jgi:hypothetical protein
VSPGFDYADYEAASCQELARGWASQRELIRLLTRF